MYGSLVVVKVQLRRDGAEFVITDFVRSKKGNSGKDRRGELGRMKRKRGVQQPPVSADDLVLRKSS